MKWRILWTKAALKDAKKLSVCGLIMNDAAFRIIASFVLIVTLRMTVAAAPPSVTALIPSGCQVGQSVEVAAQGSVGEKPQAWVSREGLKIEFPEAGNKFKVTVAENAAPGLCWIRVFNAEGASPLRPFENKYWALSPKQAMRTTALELPFKRVSARTDASMKSTDELLFEFVCLCRGLPLSICITADQQSNGQKKFYREGRYQWLSRCRHDWECIIL